MNFPNRFNEEFQKELESKPFPVSHIPTKWCAYAFAALELASPMSLGINADKFKEFAALFSNSNSTIKELTLYQFAILSNNLETRTPRELFLTMMDYCDLMYEASKLSILWNSLTKDLREEVTARLQEEMKMKGVAEKQLFRPVKAEA